MEAMVKGSLSTIVPLAVYTLLGAFLGKTKFLNPECNKSLASAFSKVLFPVFLFTKIGQTFHSSLVSEVAIYFTPVFSIAVGSVIAYLNSILIKSRAKFTHMCLISFYNAGTPPLLLVRGACSSYGALSESSYCKDAEGYVSISIMITNLIVWTYAYWLIQFDIERENRKLKFDLKSLLGPVPLACYMGICVGLMPKVSSELFESSGILFSVMDSMQMIGEAGIIVSQIMLGSYLMLTDRQGREKGTLVIDTLIIKLIIFPVLGLAYVYLFDQFSFFSDNDVLKFVCFLCFASPSPLLILIINQNLNIHTSITSYYLFWIYLFSPFSLFTYTCIFFLFIKQ